MYAGNASLGDSRRVGAKDELRSGSGELGKASDREVFVVDVRS